MVRDDFLCFCADFVVAFVKKRGLSRGKALCLRFLLLLFVAPILFEMAQNARELQIDLFQILDALVKVEYLLSGVGNLGLHNFSS